MSAIAPRGRVAKSSSTPGPIVAEIVVRGRHTLVVDIEFDSGHAAHLLRHLIMDCAILFFGALSFGSRGPDSEFHRSIAFASWGLVFGLFFA